MGFDMDVRVFQRPSVHDASKACFMYECEPDEDDLLTDVCARFNDGDVPWDCDAIHATMQTHFYSNGERLCERCCFFTRMVRPLDSRHIQHGCRNPIMGSKWFLNNVHCITCGPVSDLFHAQHTRLFEMTPSSVADAVASLQQAAPMRTSDKEAVEESLGVLRWVQGWFERDPAIVVLVNSDY